MGSSKSRNDLSAGEEEAEEVDVGGDGIEIVWHGLALTAKTVSAAITIVHVVCRCIILLVDCRMLSGMPVDYQCRGSVFSSAGLRLQQSHNMCGTFFELFDPIPFVCPILFIGICDPYVDDTQQTSVCFGTVARAIPRTLTTVYGVTGNRNMHHVRWNISCLSQSSVFVYPACIN